MTSAQDLVPGEESSSATTSTQLPKPKAFRKTALTLTSLPAEVFEQIGYFAALCSTEDKAAGPAQDVSAGGRAGKSSDASSIGCSEATKALNIESETGPTSDAKAGTLSSDEKLSDTLEKAAGSLPAAISDGAASSTASPAVPPTILATPVTLRNLLLVCRTVHERLNATANPRLYARIFETRFDVTAIRRRFGREAVSSRSLAYELKRRYIALKRIRYAVAQGQYWSALGKPEASDADITENLWVAYLMLVENDGLNMQQLQWANVLAYAKMFQSQELLESAIRDGYPTATLSRTLSMQVSYLLTDVEDSSETNKDEDEERLFIMRPFVFAAHKYDAFLAPWTCRSMPMSSEQQQATVVETPSEQVQAHPFVANLTPKDNGYTMRYCGQQITMCPPNITTAACQAFFSKVERDPAVNGFNSIQDVYEENFEQIGDRAVAEAEVPPTLSAAERSQEVSASGQIRRDDEPIICKKNPITFRSIDHDKDLKRLMLCTSPSSQGFSHIPHIGSVEGTWEGRFTFFDFDSYRDMLGGKIRALYEGPFGEQPQVWKLREHVVKVDDSVTEGGKGNVLNAGYFDVDDEPSRYKALSERDRERLNTLVAQHEIFGDIQKRDARATLQHESTRDEADPAKEKSDRSLDHRSTDSSSGLPATQTDTSGTDRYEILLSGTGHSAWGRFVLRGRVRTWDGLVTMVKEYRPDGRGRWLYRGYVVAGNKFVGRWRDTFTPADMSGYEGCFQLYRRS